VATVVVKEYEMLRTLVLQGGKYYTMKGSRNEVPAAGGNVSGSTAAPMQRAVSRATVAAQQKNIRSAPAAVEEIPLAPLAHARSAK